jgi:Uma2 family endonuclease
MLHTEKPTQTDRGEAALNHEEHAAWGGGVQPLVLRLQPAVELNADQFFALCQQNRDLRIERTAEGDVIVMPPTGWKTTNRNARITAQLLAWADQDGSGLVADSSGGFTLPNGATRSPDAAWVRRSRVEALPADQNEMFLPLCPDFVVELRSPSDSLPRLQEKMREYVSDGAQLGWLIDPLERQVYVYRPNAPVESLDNPAQLSGEAVLPGFVLSLAAVWEPEV